MNPLLRRLVVGVIALSVSAGQAADAAAEKYDLILRNGSVVDGSGQPSFQADLAIRGDRIARIGAIAGDATRAIDARGLVVAPGFIDIHSHSDWVLFEDGNAQSKIHQGVTTEVLGESTSPAPFQGQLPPRVIPVKDERRVIRRLRDYFEAIERAGISVNLASYVGQGQVWECVMGNSFARPDPRQLEEMKRLIAEAMSDGAFGMSTALMMPPSSLATTEDLVELCRGVHDQGGIYVTHMRDEGLGIFNSVQEAIRIGEAAGVRVDILHLKIAEETLWGRMNEVVALIEAARARGVDVQANVYPYTRGNNDLVSIIPPWAHEGGTTRLLERLADPQSRERLRRDIRQGVPGWYNHYTAVGGDWRRMLVSGSNPYQGLTMDRVIARKSEGRIPPPDPLDLLFDLLIEQGGSVSTVFAHHTEEDMNLALGQSWCSVGSDGSALATEGILRRGNPHPRSFGTFPRVLGVYVRERGLLRLEEAVRKMTSLNAAKIGLRDRGLLREGAFADIVVFDPRRIVDRATYADPFQYGEGIEHVLVNGRLVLERGLHTGARPGRALRHAAPADAATHVSASDVGPSPVTLGTSVKALHIPHAGEGPAWQASSGSLYFTGDDRITRLDADGSARVFRESAGGANGLLFDAQGRLVTCEARNRRVTRTERDGAITVLADRFGDRRFNSPNDLTLDSTGRIYFTDPRYGARETMEMRDEDGALVEGVYRIDAPGRVQRILAREVERPNGILISPGDRFLFVADNNNNQVGGARKLWRFVLNPDGRVNVDSRTLIFDWKTSRGPDGLKMDTKHRLFVAAGLNVAQPPFETVEPYPAGIYLLTQEGGWLGFVPVPADEVTNCAFGGPDLKTLFITAGSTLWSIPVNDPGQPPGSP